MEEISQFGKAGDTDPHHLIDWDGVKVQGRGGVPFTYEGRAPFYLDKVMDTMGNFLSGPRRVWREKSNNIPSDQRDR